MNKSTLIFTLLSFLFSACFSSGSMYKYEYILTSPTVSSDLKFSDYLIDIDFDINEESINFRLDNKADNSIKILWDEASLVFDGQSKRVIHKGIKLIDSDKPQPPTVIPPHAFIKDLVVPSENIYYRESIYSGGNVILRGGWEQKDLLPTNDRGSKQVETYIKNMKGKTIQLYLPIYYKNDLNEYIFDFTIDNILRGNIRQGYR